MKHCANCHRQFTHPTQYKGSPRGLICRHNVPCAARAAAIRSAAIAKTISTRSARPCEATLE